VILKADQRTRLRNEEAVDCIGWKAVGHDIRERFFPLLLNRHSGVLFGLESRGHPQSSYQRLEDESELFGTARVVTAICQPVH